MNIIKTLEKMISLIEEEPILIYVATIDTAYGNDDVILISDRSDDLKDQIYQHVDAYWKERRRK